jgi:DNA-binding FrmR family transcriptional regulator
MPAPKHADTKHADVRNVDHSAADHGTKDIVRRLKSVEGHVRGVQRMVEDGEYCIDVVNQIIAIQRALKKVSALLLDHHLHACVTDAMRGGDAAARERVLGELLEVFDATGRA